MGETDHEIDPRRRVPTFLWLVLGLFVVVVFAGLLMLHGHPHTSAVGPPAGSPAGQAPSPAH
jgi:hypothetical protein